MSEIWNNQSNTIITGTAYNDSIGNYSDGDNVLINSGEGNDTIEDFSCDNVTIDGGTGNDYIEISYANISIDIDNYEISTIAGVSSINGGKGNDSIDNRSSTNVKINSGADNDSIYNAYSDNVTIDGGDGDDIIENFRSSYVLIYGGRGNDSIENDFLSDLVTIDGGVGDDYITNSCNNVTINGGAGNDYIYNYGYCSSVKIDAGSGNDSIVNYYSGDVTIDSGVGDDTIYNIGSANINLVVENYTSIYSGNDILLTTKNGSVRIKDGKNQADLINIVTVKGDDGGSGSGNNTQSGGSDNIENNLDNKIIYGTNGEDALYNNGGNNVYIYGLEGNDKIGNNYTIKGTSSSFSVYCGKNVSLNGGKGNDEIYSYSPTDHIIYAAGDGDDTVFSYYSENDFKNGGSLKIHLTSGTFKGAKLDSRYHSDVIISLGSGTITLKKTSNGLPANKIPITVVDSTGKEFKFTGKYEIKAFGYTTRAGETHTATQHNGYSGESVTSKNGTAFIEKGDTIKTDSSGNISEIIISDKNHRITTPLNRSTQKMLL